MFNGLNIEHVNIVFSIYESLYILSNAYIVYAKCDPICDTISEYGEIFSFAANSFPFISDVLSLERCTMYKCANGIR